MKNTRSLLSVALAAALSAMCFLPVLGGCKKEGPGEDPKDPFIPESGSIAQDCYETLYPNGELKDPAGGFERAEDIERARAFRNGEYVGELGSVGNRHDVKLELTNGEKTRFVNVSGGYAFTLPAADYTVDYTLAQFRTVITFGDSVLSVSLEAKNPYLDTDGWYTYVSEWLFPYFGEEVLAGSGIETLRRPPNEFSREKPYGDLETLEGYDLYRYDLHVKDAGDLERPYYHIAALRKADQNKEFMFFRMKSEKDESAAFDAIVKSCVRLSPKGMQKNYFDAGEPLPNPKWNEETRAYFEKFCGEDYLNWGVFSASMPGYQDEWKPESEHYRYMLDFSRRYEEAIEEKWGAPYDIYPTYTALEYAGETVHFPVYMAEELAGGDGFNGKPVLQFTYQYTTNNNTMGSTPLFDIFRGKYDACFHQLARDVKGYRKPVLFRLNNEMNTDWTSYSGIMNLLDPDLFILSWQRLYDIFEEEGVDNAIWIWNPIADSAPYSGWGEAFCYFPGREYVQLLGETAYEFNNYPAETAASTVKSFDSMYRALYKRNAEAFSKWSVIISEFACGSGGETSGELGRNREVQLEWVKNMFKALNAANKEDYVKQIKGAIWFNANDYDADLRIANRLQFIDPYGGAYDDMQPLHEVFRAGLAARQAPTSD